MILRPFGGGESLKIMLKLGLKCVGALVMFAGLCCSCAPGFGQDGKVARSSHSVTHTLEFAKLQRRYLLYRPANLAKTAPVPLVVMLHGRFDSARYAEKAYRWDEFADAHGFVVAYPDGYGHMWNAGRCCGSASANNVDDVGFLTELIRQVSKDENIDAKRIYIAGMSMGALMAYRMVCESPIELAAIGAVAGDLAFPCPAPHPVSILEIHGGRDNLIPLQGRGAPDSARYIPPVNDILSKWRVVDRCDDAHDRVNGEVSDKVNQCDAGREVELIVIADARHQWPEGRRHIPVLNLFSGVPQPSQELDATARLWAFFAAHPLPEPK